MNIPITPETKIAELLDAYPQLEEVLIRQSAHFTALKNPILRKTVAKVATIEKAAQMSGIPVRRLVATLRRPPDFPGSPTRPTSVRSWSPRPWMPWRRSGSTRTRSA